MHPITPVGDHIAMGRSVSFKERCANLDDRLEFSWLLYPPADPTSACLTHVRRRIVRCSCRVLEGAGLADSVNFNLGNGTRGKDIITV